MKNRTKLLFLPVSLCLLVGCNATSEEQVNDEKEIVNEVNDDADKTAPTTNASKAEVANNPSANNQSNKTPSKEDSKKDEDILAKYSSKQIEYARIWAQFAPHQEIDTLHILHIPAGTPLNPDDETSGVYPEDVVQLSGSRLVDGSITYSGNGDGTINIYNVPLRWDGQYPAGEKFYQEIIGHTKRVYVKPQSDETIVALIKLQR